MRSCIIEASDNPLAVLAAEPNSSVQQYRSIRRAAGLEYVLPVEQSFAEQRPAPEPMMANSDLPHPYPAAADRPCNYLTLGNGGLLPVEGNYRLIQRIGMGSFGEVWRAEAPGGVEAAVKVIIRPIDHKDARRELQSLELIKRLRHPFLLQTQAYWLLQDRLLVAMELADGNLHDRAKECRQQGQPGIPLQDLLTYFREAAEAVDFLHSKNVLHRDIKPDNILLLQGHAKVADFGLARFQESQGQATATGAGTPAYMAPEVWLGEISRHSDQYSLAMSYAELRLGRSVFLHGALPQVMQDHLENTPNLTPLTAAEQQVLLRALAKDPSERFPSCLEFVEALAQATSQESLRLTLGDCSRTLNASIHSEAKPTAGMTSWTDEPAAAATLESNSVLMVTDADVLRSWEVEGPPQRSFGKPWQLPRGTLRTLLAVAALGLIVWYGVP